MSDLDMPPESWVPPVEPPEDPFEREDLPAAPPLRAVSAEHRLLGALLQDPTQAAAVRGRVTGIEFATPVLGLVFERMSADIARNDAPTTASLSERFPGWGVRGLSAADPFTWDDVDVLPWLAYEYADAIRSAYLRAEGDRIVLGVRAQLRDTGTDPLTVLSAAHTALAAMVDASVSPDASAIVALRFIVQMEQTYDWVLPGMLERGDRLIVTGGEGGGKTTFLRQIALAAAAGIHPLRPFAVDPKRVLVVDAENSKRQWSRAAAPIVAQLRNLGMGTDPVDRVGVVCTPRLNLTHAPDLAQVHRWVDEWKPDMLMIGPLYRLVPHAITNDDHASPLLTALDSLRDRGLALLLEAHAGKSTDVGGDRNMAPRGSSALMGWPEFGLGLRPVKDDPSMVALSPWRGGRDERAWPKHLRRGTRLPWENADPI